MTEFDLKRLARNYIGEPTDRNAHLFARAYVRNLEPSKTRKILVSYGWGAGWSTWSSCEIATEIMLSYAPLVKAIEADEEVGEAHPSVVSMLAAIGAAGGESPYLGGLEGLVVVEVEGPFCVEEYDGNENIRTEALLRT